MKRIVITESERKNILRSHGVILEQTAAEMLAAIQTAINTNPDKKIGHDTTSKLVSALKELPSTPKFDFSCVKNNKNMTRVYDYDDNDVAIFKGYQIGELVFDKTGNYYNVKDESKKYTYKCNGVVIETTNDGNIGATDTKKDNSEYIRNYIDSFEDGGLTKEQISKSLLKKYSKEDIIKANPSYESVLNQSATIDKSVSTSEKEKSVRSTDKKVNIDNEESISDETNLFNVSDKSDK